MQTLCRRGVETVDFQLQVRDEVPEKSALIFSMEIPEFSSNTARRKPLVPKQPDPSVRFLSTPTGNRLTDGHGATAAVITRRAGNVDNLAVGVRCRRLAGARSVDA